MNVSAALRHTLLRIIWEIPADIIAPEVKEDVAASLKVGFGKDRIHITWRRNGKQHSRHYPRSLFELYRRGDRSRDAPITNDKILNTNREQAIKIVRDLFSSSDLALPARLPLPTERDKPKVGVGLWPIVVVAAFYLDGMVPGMLLVSIALVTLLLFERFWYPWIGLATLPLAALPWIGYPFTVFFGALGMVAVATISPRPERRLFLVSVIAGVFLSSIASWMTTIPFEITLSGWHWLAFSMCLLATIFGWTSGIHVYIVPLTLPLFGMGSIFDGQQVFAMCIALAVIFSTILSGFVQSNR
jgi:hypothetical protein